MTFRNSFTQAAKRLGLYVCALLAFVLMAMPGVAQESQSEKEAVNSDAPIGDAKKAAILTLHGDITDVTAESLTRRVAMAKARGVDVIVFDLDTPGGLVTSAIEIADLIRNLVDIKTIAWVNPDAYSGGTIVAVACDEIVMARSSRMGDSQVIMVGEGGAQAVPEDLRAKAYTPVLHDFRMSAKLNGYSEVLSEAFVIPERVVWWLENIKTGEREFVFDDEKVKRVGGGSANADIAWKKGDAVAEGASEREWKLVETYFDIVIEKELPLTQPVVSGTELLQMSPGEAHAFGFSKALVPDRAAMKARYNIGDVVELDALWSETMAHWLTSMPVRGFLLIVFFLGLYVEFHTPGVGLAGLVSVIVLTVFVGAPFLTGLANVFEIVLILIGIILLGIEIFVIPGFGVAGVSGLLLIFAGIVATFIPDQPGQTIPSLFPALPATIDGLKTGAATLLTSLLVSMIGMAMLSRYLPKMPLFRALVTANPMPSEVQLDDPYRGAAHVGDVGECEGMLRPSGRARFGSVLVDVVTQGDLIEAGTKVEVVERRGNRVVVRAVV